MTLPSCTTDSWLPLNDKWLKLEALREFKPDTLADERPLVLMN